MSYDAATMAGCSIKQAAKAIGMCRETLRKIAPKCPAVFGKPRRVDVVQLVMWLHGEGSALFNAKGRLRTKGRGGHDPRPGVVYAILHPITHKPMYVGKTGNSLRRRRYEHDSKLVKGTHENAILQQWWNDVPEAQRVFRLVVLQECLPGTLDQCEEEWIARYLKAGHTLANLTTGGDGFCVADEVKAKLSEISKAKWQDEAYRARWLEAMRKRRPATRLLTAEEKAATRAEGRAQWLANMELHRQRQAERRAGLVPLRISGKAIVMHLTQGMRAIVDAKHEADIAGRNWYMRAGRGARCQHGGRKVDLGRLLACTPKRRNGWLDYRQGHATSRPALQPCGL